MMSTQLPTTWMREFKEVAEEEGSALLFEGDRATFASAPTAKLAVGRWEDLYAAAAGGYMGYLSYEMGANADKDYQISLPKSDLPLALFYKHAKIWEKKRELLPPISAPALELVSLSYTKQSYLQKIADIKELIAAGEVYQVNLSQKFTFTTELSSFALFERLLAINPASYAAYLNCGEFAILSFSPELFLQKKGERLISSPIKGTAPRGKTLMQDQQNRRNLWQSEKQRAELLMITDLMRNDFSKVCSHVETRELFGITAHPSLFHLHATVEGLPRPLHPIEQIRALFPAGSITGCPKLRAMELIAQLEMRPRGVYTGAIGRFYPNGDFTFNVAIRTLTYRDGIVEGSFGGAIIYDSNQEEEYAELFHKAAFCFSLCHTACEEGQTAIFR